MEDWFNIPNLLVVWREEQEPHFELLPDNVVKDELQEIGPSYDCSLSPTRTDLVHPFLLTQLKLFWHVRS